MATGISKSFWKKNMVKSESGLDQTSLMTLTYPGKKSESEILSSVGATIKPVWPKDALNTNSPNRLYFGENLKILAALLKDDSVRGKVKLIYIDPPYATNSIFQCRNKQADAYQDLLSGPHYLEFLRERLIMMRELLADDGSIYVHLDENMAFHAKIIMDEVFGRKNYRNWITRKKCNPKNYTRNTYGNVSDYILFYSKTENFVWNRSLEKWTDERALKEYEFIDQATGRRYKRVPIHAPGVRNGETGKPWRGLTPPPGKHWQYTPARLDEMDARGEIYWSKNGNPRRKVFFDKSAGVPVQDIWLDFRDAHNQNIHVTGYPTEKNFGLLKRIIEASSNPGDLVMDSFCGSGTTLAAAAESGRRWLGIDSSPIAISTVIQRFLKGTQPMGDFVEHVTGRAKASLKGKVRKELAPELPLLDRAGFEQDKGAFALLLDELVSPVEQKDVPQWKSLLKAEFAVAP